MPGRQVIQISDAVGLYEKSSFEVSALKVHLPESDIAGILKEVLNRVKEQPLFNTTSIDLPSRKKVERLCYALISDDGMEGQRFIESVYEDGASLDAIYLSYLAEAARILGEWWETDHASFVEVSIGTSRIYAIMRGLSYLFVPTGPAEVKSAVFAAIPNETHILGIQMAADLFGKEGWDIDLLVGRDHEQLVAEISRSNCRIIGLSAGGAHSVAPLARLVIALRVSNPGAAIFLSGQITHEAREAVSVIGFDGIISDVPTALAQMNNHWQRLTAQ